jgi:hypothetical protein
MDPILIGGGAVAALGLVGLLTNGLRNRPFTKEAAVFRASRWTRGNHVWPTQVAVFPTQVVRYTPRLFGHFEETIAIHQVASVSIDAGFLFADVIIETSGGSQPIRCHGHGKRDADEIRRLISEAQSARSGATA